jgi:hypothetical protein
VSQDRIRNASILDLDSLGRLLSMARHDVTRFLMRGHLLVLERDDGALEAACHVEMTARGSWIDLLVIEPNADTHVRPRMRGVANALCEAYGYPVAA